MEVRLDEDRDQVIACDGVQLRQGLPAKICQREEAERRRLREEKAERWLREEKAERSRLAGLLVSPRSAVIRDLIHKSRH